MVEIDYVLNKDYISKVLCIEKDVVGSSCQGKCHLKKELDKVETSPDSNENTPKRIQLEDVRFVQNSFGDKFNGAISESSARSTIMSASDVDNGFTSIFLPPPEMSYA